MKDHIDYSRFENFQKVLGMNSYVVKKGDTLSEIAHRHKLTVNDLMSINQLANDYIYPNQVLYLPTRDDVYVTKNKDTLGSVISTLGIELDLGEYRDLLHIELAPNTEIRFEERKRSNITTYQGGDIKAFCEKNRVSMSRLLELNFKEWLKAGTRVIIR